MSAPVALVCLVFLSLLTPSTWADVNCEAMASSLQASESHPMNRVQAFVVEQLENGRLSVDQVEAAFQNGVASGSSIPSILAERTLRQMIERESFSLVDRQQFQSWLTSMRGSSNERQKITDLTAMSVRMVFHQLHFADHSFELMETSVTREMWRIVMGASLGSDPVFAPDLRPVTFVTSAEVEDFVARLNKKLEREDAGALRLVEGHQAGHHYRLPSFVEFRSIRDEILNRYGGIMQITRASLSREWSVRRIAPHVWFVDSSEGADHPMDVATKEAFLLQNRPFFDLLGNVTELIFKDEDGQRLYGVWGGHIRSVESAFQRLDVSHFEAPVSLRIDQFASVPTAHPLMGFRLVRERRR